MNAATVALVVFSFLQTAPGPDPAEWRIDTDRSELTLHVFASGVLSPLLHDHHFRPTDWRGTVRFDPDRPEATAVEATIAAGSLENHQPALSAEDHETVRQQVEGPDILDVENHPEIRFVATHIEVQEHKETRLEGALHGRLTVRGQTAPVVVRVNAVWSSDRLRVSGISSFEQSAFGIEPYSRFLGTVAVRDEVQVELKIEAVRQVSESTAFSGSHSETRHGPSR